MDITLILTSIGLLLSILIPLLGFYKRKKELYNYYSVIWKKSSEISAKEILGERPCEAYYLKRDIDDILLNRLKNNQNTLVIGQPLSGKTRAVFNSLKNFTGKLFVLVPRSVSMPVFHLPKYSFLKKRKVIFIDDLQHYTEKQENYHLLFKQAQQKNIPIIAACHSGKEFLKVKNKLTEQNLNIDFVFGEGIVEMAKLPADAGKMVAEKLGMQWDSVKFNGTIGSIFMRLTEMERRFDGCDTIEKTILRVLRNLYLAGIYEDNNIIKTVLIKKAAGKYELEAKEFEWSGWLKTLEGKEFIKVMPANRIWAEDAYLEYVVKPEAETSKMEIFENAAEIFNDDPEVLQMVGERIYNHGIDDPLVNDYINLSVKTFNRALELIKNSGSPDEIIRVKKSLGLAYWILSKTQDTLENSQKAIGYFNEILDGITPESKPYEFAKIKWMIGSVYLSFTNVKNIEENSQKAIGAFNEALRFFTEEKYPLDLAKTYNGLGTAYETLGETKDPVQNYHRALEAYSEARRIGGLSGFPLRKNFTKFNTANTYSYLSEYEEPEKNLSKAIELYRECLQSSGEKISSPDDAGVMNNMGYAYAKFAKITSAKQNINSAIEAYNKALEIRTVSQMPIEHIETMYNLGEAYLQLSEIENEKENIQNARACLEETLTIKAIEKYPRMYSGVKFTLGMALIRLAEIGENSGHNNDKGITQLREASEIVKGYSDAEYEMMIAELNKAKKKFAGERN